MFLSTWHPHPLLFSAGPIHLYWYGLLLAIAAIAGLLVVIRIGKKVQLESAWLTDLFIALVIGGFIGARLYHVLNEWNFYLAQPTEIWRIWNVIQAGANEAADNQGDEKIGQPGRFQLNFFANPNNDQ
jgi:prolipoprotein diacylglyceryltransferase